MSSRVVSTALPLRTVTRTTSLALSRAPRGSQLGNINPNATAFATLDESGTASRKKVLSSPNVSLARSLNFQIVSSKPPYSNSIWIGGDSAKTFEKDRRFHGQQGKIARAWEPVEKELWLERFGGPGNTVEKVVGKGTVVVREIGADGKGYLRVLI